MKNFCQELKESTEAFNNESTSTLEEKEQKNYKALDIIKLKCKKAASIGESEISLSFRKKTGVSFWRVEDIEIYHPKYVIEVLQSENMGLKVESSITEDRDSFSYETYKLLKLKISWK